ncbi:MAG: ABC transporter substrate-binding protein [Oscillospiraceae bacterium]|nr:ABC transporter substrate-binding protein [Oscillospiraceae bacterium]
MKLKKTLALLMVLAMLFTLVACAGGGADPTPAPATPAPTPTPATDDNGDDDPPGDLPPILIGGINDLSGPRSISGNQIYQGARLKVEEVNAAGGLLGGRMIEFIQYDNRNDPQETISAYMRLVEVHGVSAVLGSDASGIQMGLIEISTELEVPVVGMPSDPRATMDIETGEVHPFTFLVSQPNAIIHAEVTANYIIEETEMRSPAVIFDQANAYTVAFQGAFIAYWEDVLGLEIAIVEIINAQDQDFRTQLGRIQASGADVIISPNTIPQNVLLVNQAQQLGMELPFAGSLDMADPFITLINDPYYLDAIVPQIVYMGDPRMAGIIESHTARFGFAPEMKTVNGYDAMTVLVAAIELAGSDDPVAIRDAIRNITNLYTLVSPTYTQDASTHAPLDLGMNVIRIQNGEQRFEGFWRGHS